MSKSTSTASVVRAWAVEQGLPVKSGEGVRGRIPNEVIAAFDAAHPQAKYAVGPKVVTRKVTAKPEKGRSVTRTVNAPEVREWAQAKGLTDKGKGRLPEAVLRAFVLDKAGKA